MYTNWRQTGFGFTLLEILIVLAVIGILASMVLFNTADSGKQARDAQRQADLRELQSAIELYKNKYSEYPEGCNGAGNWSGQQDSIYACASGNEYIVGISEFLPNLPSDPRLNGNEGYVYVVNSNRTVYKIMAMNTVESELVDYNHSLQSCHIVPDNLGRLQNVGSNDMINEIGWCKKIATSPTNYIDTPVQCRMSTGINASDGGNGRFEASYGLWGGFEPDASGANQTARARYTTSIICK